MSDTIRIQEDLLKIFADNTQGLISAQDVRDLIVSTAKSTSTRDNDRLLHLGSTDRQRSGALARLAYENSRSGIFTETWSDLTNWSSGSAVQVSNGAMYSAGQANGSGINHSFALSATQTARIVLSVTMVGTGASGGVIVGVSSDTAGGTATPSAAKMRGLSFSGSGTMQSWDQGTGTTVVGTPTTWTAGVYTVTIIVDLKEISVVAVNSAGTAEFRAKFSRNNYVVNNIALFNSDSRQLTGSFVGPLSAVTAIATTTQQSLSSSSFTENWTNLSAWSSGTAVQVSGNKMYSAGNAGNSGINHSFVANANAVISIAVNLVLGGESGGVIAGVSSDTAGGAATAGGGRIRGIYFTSGGPIQSWDQGTATTIGSWAGHGTTATLQVTMTSTQIIAVATCADGISFTATFNRAGYNVNNIAIFNSDSRQLSGLSVGPVTASNIVKVEGVNRTAHWTTVTSASGAACNIKISLPPSYDSRIPSPLVIMFHGNGSDENIFSDNNNGYFAANGFLAAGFVVLTAAYTPFPSTWGAQGSLDAYYGAYQYCRDNYAIGPVVLYGNSMGGIESLLTLAERRIPGVVAWIGTSPTGNLHSCYTNGGTGVINSEDEAIGTGGFSATINNAYGITGTGNSTYDILTAGHDPALKSGDAYRSVPMLFFAATDDFVVLKKQNTDVIAALVALFCPDLQVVPTTGGHSFNLSPYVNQMVAFGLKYCVA